MLLAEDAWVFRVARSRVRRPIARELREWDLDGAEVGARGHSKGRLHAAMATTGKRRGRRAEKESRRVGE